MSAAEILLVLMFVVFIGYVCKEINAQSPDVWVVGWQRMEEGQCGREKGRGHYRQVTLSRDPWAHISGKNKSAEHQSLSFGLYLLL